MHTEYTEQERAALEAGTTIRVNVGGDYPLATVTEATPETVTYVLWTGAEGTTDTAYKVDPTEAISAALTGLFG